MKPFFTIALLLLLSTVSLQAAHVAGAQMEYKYLNNSKYEITLTVYRDCNSTTISNSPISFRCAPGQSSSGSGTFSLSQISLTDVTGIKPGCNTQSRCSGSYSFGFHEYVFRGTLDLSAFNCCEIILSWEQSSGASFSTLSASGIPFYTEARINKCAPSSLQWTKIPPQFLLTQGQDQILNFSASDIFDYDSISYELVDHLTASGTKASYTNQYTAKRPLTFLGFPNTSIGHPAGLQFDSLRGNLYCRPQKKDETPIICVQATEWRKINGNMTKIGSIRRDIGFVVLSNANGNKNTVQSSLATSSFAACPGDTSVAVIKFTDGDVNDTFDFQFTHNLKWARASFLGDRTSRTIKVEYLVDSIPGGEIENAFTLITMDDNCPIAGKTIKTYGVSASPNKFADSTYITNTKKCGAVTFKANNRLQGANYYYQWDIVGNGIQNSYLADSVFLTTKHSGWVKAKLLVYSTQHCNVFELADSVYLQTNDFLSVDAGPDTKVCSSATVLNTAFPSGGTAPYTYLWSNGDTTQQAVINPAPNTSKYSVLVTDAKGCKAADYIEVYNLHPTITFTGPEKVCQNQSFSLQAAISNTIYPVTFGWQNKLDNQLQITNSITNNQTYIFTVKDTLCTFNAAKTVAVYSPQLKYNHPLTVCKGDTMRLSAIPSGGVAPYNVYWDTYSINGENVKLSTTNVATGFTYFTTTVIDSIGCTKTINGSVWIEPLPTLNLSPVGPLCENAGQVSLNSYASPTGGTWSGVGVFNNSVFINQAGGIGVFGLKYAYTSPSTGCSNNAITTLNIQAQPKADFVVDSAKARYTHTFSFTDITKNSQGQNRIWDFGDPNSGTANTSTLANPTHLYSDTGTYTVKLWVAGGFCPHDSVIKTNYITVNGKSNTKSVGEINEYSLNIYPNPAQNKVEILLESQASISTVSIFDITGKQIMADAVFMDNTAKITRTNETSGVYFVKIITTEGDNYVGKIIWE